MYKKLLFVIYICGTVDTNKKVREEKTPLSNEIVEARQIMHM